MQFRLGRYLAVTASLATSAVAAQAQNVVYWTDYNVGTNVIPGALALAQASHAGLTYVGATSQADFNAKLTSGTFQLAIFGEQGNGVFGGSSTELSAFLGGGGKILGASWLSSPMPAFFGATHTSFNQSTITGSGALFAGVTSPLTLTNPGWGVFSQGYTGAGPCLASFGDGSCAAISGNGGSTLLLGPLFDTYADQAAGEQFVANAVGSLVAPSTTTPEPASIALVAGGLLAMAGVAARRRQNA